MEPKNYKQLTQQQRPQTREQYIREQKGRCWYCKERLDAPLPPRLAALPINRKLFPTGFFNYPVHLHHNHKTGLTIGAVHETCNAILWQYEGQ